MAGAVSEELREQGQVEQVQQEQVWQVQQVPGHCPVASDSAPPCASASGARLLHSPDR